MTAVFVSPRWVMDLKQPPSWLDCRFRLDDRLAGRRLFEADHIAGAHYADLDQDLADLSRGAGRHPLPAADDFARRCAAWGLGRQPIVVYDDMSGAMAARAWWLLRWMGHREVYILDGGIESWREAGGPLTAAQPVAGQGTDAASAQGFQTAPGSMPVVSAEQVRRAIEGRGNPQTAHPWLLLDARAGERFRGEVEPIDQVAGHVPGATNRPFSDSLAAGRLLDGAALRESWQGTLQGIDPEQVTHMCGSGVTACFNLACMEHLGLSGSRLYVGSWSEWIADRDNPLAGG